jgi:secreted trypsin-like serine protease
LPYSTTDHLFSLFVAAHCVARDDLTVTDVIVSAYMSQPGQKNYETHIHARVTQTLIYPDYNKPTKVYDAALIKVSPPVTSVATLKLNVDDSAPPTGTSLTAIGMGDVDPDVNRYEGAEQLMKTTISTVDHDTCQSYYGQTNDGGQSYNGMRIDAKSMLCANTAGQDTCQGDSGGPLFKDGVLYGVTRYVIPSG